MSTDCTPFAGLSAFKIFIYLFKSLALPFFNFLKRLFIFERQRQSVSGGGAEREGDTESEEGFRL